MNENEFKYKSVYLGLFSIVLSLPAYADWYFRGTPTSWTATPMEQVAGSNTFKTCQRFSGVSNPRFKIDRFGDWRESYPANDQAVTDGTYRISFDAGTHQITVVADPNCITTDTWFFRGTPNHWATTTPMNQVDGGDLFKVLVTFTKEDPAPRFKIDHFGDWRENYPAQDMPVADCARYEIGFNRATKVIETKKLEDIKTGACGSSADFREETIGSPVLN